MFAGVSRVSTICLRAPYSLGRGVSASSPVVLMNSERHAIVLIDSLTYATRHGGAQLSNLHIQVPSV